MVICISDNQKLISESLADVNFDPSTSSSEDEPEPAEEVAEEVPESEEKGLDEDVPDESEEEGPAASELDAVGAWACLGCTSLNHRFVTRCGNCQQDRQELERAGDWRCQVQG